MSFLSDLQSSLSLTLELQLRKEAHPVVLSFVQGQATMNCLSHESFESPEEVGSIGPKVHSMKKERFVEPKFDPSNYRYNFF